VGAPGAADPRGVARRATTQDRHPDGDERHFFAAHRLLVPSAPRQLSAAIWAEPHIALRERMGAEPSPSAAVLGRQSIKYTMTKVGKSDREGTFAGTAASDGNAPLAATRFFASASAA
jgi:hypothetical protein